MRLSVLKRVEQFLEDNRKNPKYLDDAQVTEEVTGDITLTITIPAEDVPKSVTTPTAEKKTRKPKTGSKNSILNSFMVKTYTDAPTEVSMGGQTVSGESLREVTLELLGKCGIKAEDISKFPESEGKTQIVNILSKF